MKMKLQWNENGTSPHCFNKIPPVQRMLSVHKPLSSVKVVELGLTRTRDTENGTMHPRDDLTGRQNLLLNSPTGRQKLMVALSEVTVIEGDRGIYDCFRITVLFSTRDYLPFLVCMTSSTLMELECFLVSLKEITDFDAYYFYNISCWW